jgi:hypothetical protein
LRAGSGIDPHRHHRSRLRVIAATMLFSSVNYEAERNGGSE